MNNILKTDSFVKYRKIDFLLGSLNSNKKEDEVKYKNLINSKKNINILNNKNYNNLSVLYHQNFILDIIIELRDFDQKNGTDLFKNISYNNLNAFILKNNF